MFIVQGNVDVRAMTPRFGHRDAPLACLDDALSARFHAWLGASGRRYVASVFPIDHATPSAGLPDLGEAVLIAVRRKGVERIVLGVVAMERTSDWARAVAMFHEAAVVKPDEWHVHLLAHDRAARTAMVADLAPPRKVAVVA